VRLMLSDIEITPMGEHPQEKSFDAFRIAFTTENALLAQQVTSTLTSLFINEHLRSQEEQSTNTTKFLHEQVAEKKAKLDEQEQRLREFKMQHVGELPEQQQGNLGILTGLQTQLQNTMASLNRAQQQRVYLQTLIDTQKRAAAPVIPTQPGSPVVTNRPLTSLEAAQNDLARLEAKKADLLLSRTREHPDVRSLQREIAKAQETVQRLKASAPPPERDHPATASASPAKPSVDGSDPVLAQLVSQLESNRLEIENLTRDETRLKTTVGQYESRLNQIPVRE